MQGPLHGHEQRRDRDRRLPVGELRLFGDPREFELVARGPGRALESTQEVRPDGGEDVRHDDGADGRHHEPSGMRVGQDVDGGEPVGEGMGRRSPPLAPRCPHQPPVDEQDDARKPDQPAITPGLDQPVDRAKQEQDRLQRGEAQGEPHEEKAQNGIKFLFLEGIMPGTIHQCQGQEATAVGVCAALRPDDFITSTFRGHGHALAKGLSVQELLNELFGADDRLLQGQGRQHARRQHGEGHDSGASPSSAAAFPWPPAWPWPSRCRRPIAWRPASSATAPWPKGPSTRA